MHRCASALGLYVLNATGLPLSFWDTWKVESFSSCWTGG